MPFGSEKTMVATAFGTHQDSSVFFGMVEGQDARILAGLAQKSRLHLHIAADDARAQALMGLLAFFAPDVPVTLLPGWDCLPYDRVSPNADTTVARIRALSDLGAGKGGLVITTAAAVTQRLVPPEALRTHQLTLRAKGVLDPAHLETFLVRQGYARTDTVRESGEFAIRGGIIDLFPAGGENPVRADLFGDTIESLKTFDPLTQRSGAPVDQLVLLPATEYPLDEEAITRFRGEYREAFGVPAADDPLYNAISEGRRYNGAEHWLPLFYGHMATVIDYIGDAPITLDPGADQAVAERHAQIADYYQARQSFLKAKKKPDGAALYLPLSPDRLYVMGDEWEQAIANRPITRFSVFRSPDENAVAEATRARDFADIRAQKQADLFQAVASHLQTLRTGQTRKILVACYSAGSRDRLKLLLEQAGQNNLVMCDDWAACTKLMSAQTGLVVLPLEHGFTAPDLAIITEQDILGDRLIRKSTKKRKADHFITELSTLNSGDLVVHSDHGIGRFEGLETIAAAGTLHDCLKLIYDGGDRLYLPVENMELLSRFGSDEGVVQLDKLGGAGWQARKARVKKDLMRIADELLKIAAARQLRKGENFTVNENQYAAFTARFPYHETEDQLRAIDDTLGDLVKGTPSDRLICGDVGFGKTEVALRAAYVAAAAGAQVAVVAPTTLLARQHFHSFTKRFEGLGIRGGQLSRLVNAKDTKLVKQGLADGSIQIVIGTHAIFAKDIKFAHLGLLIVDEEQRFGVKQKEALKALKNDVHVITLTATPIPRTLQMALTGVKEMSVIATPPVDRLAIRTFVMPFDPMIIREAILRERHRGGQTFYVCPRIRDMAKLEEQLKELVPEVKIITAHGQLAPTDLDDRMTAFYEGKYDVLLATNIIESGLDIPTANTMIVHRADLFGLAQLYQIRGRIGRSKTRAYAYLTYEPDAKLTKQAQKRLEVIEMLDTLGSGFQLASHDMDIRGAGNLLGEEQSGHIKEVGVELYQHLLEEAVAAARAGVDTTAPLPAADWTPNINMGASILIPETYVEDLTLRLGLYRRLADLEEKAEIEAFAAELIDRFGPLPDEVKNLIDLIEIKKLCRAAGVDKVDAGPKGAVIGFYKDRPPEPEKLLAWIANKKGTIKLRPDQKLQIPREWDKLEYRVTGVRSLLKELNFS